MLRIELHPFIEFTRVFRGAVGGFVAHAAPILMFTCATDRAGVVLLYKRVRVARVCRRT